MTLGIGGHWEPRVLAVLLTIHTVGLLLILASCIRLFLTTRRPVRRTDLIWWVFAILLAYIVALRLPEHLVVADAVFLSVIGYAFWLWLVAVTGVVLTVYRLRYPARALKMGCLFTFLGTPSLLVVMAVSASPLAREATRRATCRSHLKQIGLALHNYVDADGVFPAAASGEPAVTWRVLLLPYLDQKPLYAVYDRAKTWDSPANNALAMRRVSVYECGSNVHHEDSLGRFHTDFVMVTGNGTFGGNPAGTKLADITDGTLNTIAIVEASGLQIVWTEPRDFDATTQPIGINLKGTGSTDSPGMMSSNHRGGAHVLMADGSTRFISQSIDSAVLKKLTTIAGGDVVDTDF